MGQKGILNGAQIRESLAAALKNEDLALFRTNAIAAFDSTEAGARRLKAAIDAITNEALRRAGTSLEELTTGFSKGATQAVNDVDALAQSIKSLGLTGDDASRSLAGALDKALAAAATERAVRAVIDRFEELGKQGLLSGEQVAAGLEKAKQKVDALKPGISSLSEALRAFGLKTREDLQATADKLGAAYSQISDSTLVSLADQRRAFDQWAAAATAANGGAESSSVKLARAILEVREAAVGAGKAGADAGAAIKRGMDDAAISAGNLAAAIDTISERNRQVSAEIAASDAARQAMNRTASDNTGLSSLQQKLADGTLSESDRATAQAVYNAARNNLTLSQQAGAGTMSIEGMRSVEGQARAARNILDRLNSPGLNANPRATVDAELARLAAIRAQNPSGSRAGASPFGSAASSTHTVNFNIGGRSIPVQAQSRAAAEALVRELEAAARAAGGA